MDSKLELRVERLEQPARDEVKFQAVVEARDRVGAWVDKLIAKLGRSEPIDTLGSPVPDGPPEPSRARDRVMAKIDRLVDVITRERESDAET